MVKGLARGKDCRCLKIIDEPLNNDHVQGIVKNHLIKNLIRSFACSELAQAYFLKVWWIFVDWRLGRV